MITKELAKKMRLCAEDPMWADHAEVSKQLCAAVADALDAQYVVIGYKRPVDNDGSAFWVNKTKSAYYSVPVYGKS